MIEFWLVAIGVAGITSWLHYRFEAPVTHSRSASPSEGMHRFKIGGPGCHVYRTFLLLALAGIWRVHYAVASSAGSGADALRSAAFMCNMASAVIVYAIAYTLRLDRCDAVLVGDRGLYKMSVGVFLWKRIRQVALWTDDIHIALADIPGDEFNAREWSLLVNGTNAILLEGYAEKAEMCRLIAERAAIQDELPAWAKSPGGSDRPEQADSGTLFRVIRVANAFLLLVSLAMMIERNIVVFVVGP